MALAVGCTDQLVPTVSRDSQLAEPALNLINGPIERRMSSVFRVLDVLLITSTDPDRDLLAVHFQGDDFLYCGSANLFEFADAQRNNNRVDILREDTRLVDAPIFIYKLSDLPPVPGAARRSFLAEKWLYKGIHTVIGHDGSFFTTGPGAKSLGYSATGVVFI